MLTSPDFKELSSLFKRHSVQYLPVSELSVAMRSCTEPRFTKDLDILIAVNDANAAAVYNAIKAFGAPLQNLTPQDFAAKGYFYQVGVPPLRVDVLMAIPGVTFAEAWE